MTAPTSSPYHYSPASSTPAANTSNSTSTTTSVVNDDNASSVLTTPTTPDLALALFPDAAQKDDQDFRDLMRERTKQRKEREDAQLANLRVQVRRLEAALGAETKRRVQAVAAAQAQAQQAVEQVAQQWKASLEKEGNETNARVAMLEERLDLLEQRWEKDVQDVGTAITTRSLTWKAALEDLKAQADAERKSRLQREGRLLQRIQDVSEQYQEQWKEERHTRVSELSNLTERVHIQEDARGAQVTKLETSIEEALLELNSALLKEMKERESQDEELVTVLNTYTANVQQSLSFVSGV
jgi:hypothetical protein